MKIKKAEIDKMIKEEFQKMLEKKKLSNRLNQINESLDAMDKEDEGLNEVEAGGETKVASHAWTGKADGDVKFKPEFQKKGSSLLEDEDSIEVGGDEDSIEVEETAMGEFEAKFAEIGKAIDAKMAAQASGEETEEEVEEMGNNADDEDFEEVEVSDENNGEEIEVSDDNKEEVDENWGSKKDEFKREKGEKTGDVDGHYKDYENVKNESVEEPLEGESVAQMTDADTVNDNMEKDKHVNESTKKGAAAITEAKKTQGKNIFTEGLDEKKKSNLMEELNRMKKFAGLSKDEE